MPKNIAVQAEKIRQIRARDYYMARKMPFEANLLSRASRDIIKLIKAVTTRTKARP